METDLLDELWTLETTAVEALPDTEFGRPTRAEAWTVRDLLFHQLLDAQRSLTAFASPTDAEPDVDEVSYWNRYRPSEGDGGAAHAKFVRAAAAAYPGSEDLVDHWRTTSGAAIRAARAADPAGHVETQGHVIAVPGFVSTLVLEATVHLMDLTLEIPGGPPPQTALALTRRVLEGLYGEPLPTAWDDTATRAQGHRASAAGRVGRRRPRPIPAAGLIVLG